MKKVTIIFLLVFGGLYTAAQNTLTVTITDSNEGDLLIGATAFVKDATIGASADVNGKAIIKGIPDGEQTIVISFIGYDTEERVMNFPPAEQSIDVALSPGEELDEVIIESTRSNKSIESIPTRTEVLTEEIAEAATMDPAKIAHLITHSTGIQVQQNSATSGYANVRIQGLDGKYALFLKDGFPLYGGFSGSLGIMHIPPLDLRQVEYIKGPASTLHGAGAISGLINLISKEPREEGELNVMVNKSHLGATDFNSFYSKKYGKMGITMYAGYDAHTAFDADDDGFSDIPEQLKFNFNPKVFFYFNDKTKAYIGATVTSEVRAGGDMRLLNDNLPDTVNFYKESNTSDRITSQAWLQRKVNANSTLTVKNSVNVFDRTIGTLSQPGVSEYIFSGRQVSTFSELSYNTSKGKHNLVTGLNYYTDQFDEEQLTSFVSRDWASQIFGGFAQHTWDVSSAFSIESGFRGDYEMDYGFFPLPRIALLMKWNKNLTSRVGGAMGYSLPSIFISESERLGYEGVLPVSKTLQKPERSLGVNGDINYKVPLEEWGFFRINQLFFFNRINDPLQLMDITNGSGIYQLSNIDGYIESRGFETSMKFGFGAFTLFAGYTYTDAQRFFDDGMGQTISEVVPMTAQHSLKGDLLYDLPDKWQLAFDYSYKSPQELANGDKTNDLLIFGLVARRWIGEHWQLFGNIENFTDVRQTRYESLVSGPYNTPQFTEVWAPLDGFYVNAGFKVML